MNTRKTITILIILVLTALGLSGCTTFEHFKIAFIDKQEPKEGTIRIGVFEPLSGADSSKAALEIEGIEMAHEMYPTVGGKEVELIYADNKSDIDAAETAIETLISHEPLIILGSYGNVYSLAASSYINEAKVPTIAITNANPLVTKNYKYYCRVCYVDSNQGDLLAQYVLNDRKEKTAGLLVPAHDDAALAEATAFADRIRAETGNDDAIVVYEDFESGSKDFSRQLKKIKASGVKQVMIAGDMADAVNIINQAAKKGLDVQFLGSSDWGTEDFVKALDNHVQSDDMAFVQFFASDGDAATPLVSKEKETFLNAYKERHDAAAVPEDAVALGYDAYCLALDAINKAPEGASRQDILEMMIGSQYQFEGVTGLINFSSIGDPIKTAYISTWVSGKINTLYTIEPVE